MEPRKRARRGTASSGVAAPASAAERLLLPHIGLLIDEGGQITVGALPPVNCLAIANDDYNCLAMLPRQPAETLQQLLERLDAAIDLAWTADQFTDEINPPSPPTNRR